MITTIKKLTEIINGRPVLIMLHGKSIEELEANIEQLKDKDICYTSLNYFDLMEDCILSKIDKKLDFAFDSAGIKAENIVNYVCKRRFPRWQKYLSRQDDNMILTTKGVLDNFFTLQSEEYVEIVSNFLKKSENKLMLLDSLGIDLINMPNSACLLIDIVMLARTQKIIICGMDGYLAKPQDSVPTYYKKELYTKHREDAFGDTDITHLNGDTINFNLTAKTILEQHCDLLDIKMPEIYNCSPNSLIEVFPKINYKQLVDIL